MNGYPGVSADTSLKQQADIRDRCFHPKGVFKKFEKQEIEQSISDRFEQQALRYPDRLAIKSKNRALSYNELNVAANRIARAILNETGERGEPVSLLFKHNATMIAAILGVLKAGKIYVPLDALFPKARLEYILEDSQSNFILTDTESLCLAKKLAKTQHKLINVDELGFDLSAEHIGLSIPPDSPIYILYTSGSTGQPKGVVQNHRHRLHDIMIHTNGLHICAEDRLVLLYSCSTGMGTTVLFSALLNGAALYLYDLKEEGIGSLSPWLIQQRITIYTSITSVLRHFFSTLKGDEKFPDLRIIYQSGEPLYKRDVDFYKKHFSKTCIMINGMGAGETARLRRYYMDRGTRIPGNVVPIGYAVEDKEVLLLDEQGREVGFDQVGEIAIKSHYISPGYWRRPDLTEAVFISNPKWEGKRIYLTGDLGLMSSDGCLLHMGRKDFQVKIRGNRVEIPEVESVLFGLETIKDVVVVLNDDSNGDRKLVAYVVPNVKPPPDVTTLWNQLAQILPDYMIPSSFVFLEALPRLPNGKIDRLSLPAPPRRRPGTEETFVAPRDALEKSLAKIWEKTLKISRVGVRDDFFALGGDSLGAIVMSLQVEKTLGRKLPLAILLETRTVEKMAERFRKDGWARSWSSLVPLQAEGSKPPLFCVHGLGGYVLFYSELARNLKPDQPFYGLQAAGLDGEQPPYDQVEDMAAHYIKEIRTIQPQGPYFLGGFCVGSYIALEMAQQLRSQGQKVSLLVAFNPPGNERMDTSFLHGIRFHMRNFLTMKSKQKVDYLVDRTAFRLRQIRNTSGNFLYNSLGSRGRSLFPMLHRIHIQELSHRAGVKYEPRYYQGQLTIFICTADLHKHSELFWQRVAGDGVEIHPVPGKRFEIFREPSVQILTQKLRASLEKAQRNL